MFNLNIRKTPVIDNSSLPDDNGINSILENFFDDITPTSTDSSNLKLLLENIKITIPNALDYRNPNLKKNIVKYKRFVNNLNCRDSIKTPFISILEFVNNYSSKEQNCNAESILDSYTSKQEYSNDLEFMDIAMELNKYGYITNEVMETYVSENRDKVLQSVYDVNTICRATLKASEEDSRVTESSICITESYPNEAFITNIVNAIYESDGTSNITVSDDEYRTLMLDTIESKPEFLGDDMGRVYNIMQNFVSDAYYEMKDIKQFIEDANSIRKAYIRYPTLMLHNIMKHAVLIINQMCTEYEDWRDSLKIKKFKNVIMTDIKDYELNGVVMDKPSSDIYGKIFESFQTSDLMNRTWIDRKNHKRYASEVNLTESLISDKLKQNNFEDSIQFSSTTQELLEPTRGLLESFEVLQDGTIKVTLDRNATYMNEYMSNHRLLLANKDLGNYEGMKYNLVYNLILIESIEKNVLYNKRVKKDSSLYEDAEKARKFAKNDIATYLPELRKHQANFDLNKFYNEVKADKNTIKIDTVSTISGVKLIISSIL